MTEPLRLRQVCLAAPLGAWRRPPPIWSITLDLGLIEALLAQQGRCRREDR